MMEPCKACENGTLTIEYQRELVVGHCPFCEGTGQRDYEAERKADAEFTAKLNDVCGVMDKLMSQPEGFGLDGLGELLKAAGVEGIK